jgi:peptidoglycan/LPS O-acetylase OafA/YrhL
VTAASAPSPRHRLDNLDGLRTVAIAAVMLFHYTVRWTTPTHSGSLYPYDDALAGVLPFQYGWLGVQLFFIISGFVITLTLQRCSSLWEFAARRYSRLAPAMLIGAIATFLVVALVPSNPFETRPLWFFSSLTFLDPQDLNMLAGDGTFRSIDTSYWSLYVEVKFYVVAGLLYFLLRKRFALAMCAAVLAGTAAYVYRVPMLSGVLDRLLVPLHMPWFILGVGFYYLYKRESVRSSAALIATAALCLATLQLSDRANVPWWATACLPLLFLAVLELPAVGRVLAARPLVIAGTASYSCYLLHQYIGVTILEALPDSWNGTAAAIALVLAMMLLMTLISVASFRLLEAPASRWVLKKLLVRPNNSNRQPVAE